ncbi:MAG: hypothetical protein KDA25_08345, partial [Phycisphaerales bacterium]|nr:hypothetical protein [Phycisphaerales bacterium]
VVTFAGAGDPLLHPEFDAMVALARDAGIGGVHIRTTLDVEPPVVDRLAACAPDVVSIDLHADRGATAAAMFGTDHLGRLIDNIVRLQGGRRRFSPGDSLALGLPWIVPRIVRCDETYEDIDTFFDRWQHLFGAAVIEGTPPYEGTVHEAPNDLERAATPLNVARREGRRRLIVCADGTVPMCELELPERPCAGSIMERPLEDLWRDVLAWRRAAWADGGMTPRTRMARP